jgi:hypothetical protein
VFSAAVCRHTIQFDDTRIEQWPKVKHTAAGQISTIFDRPSRDTNECIRANDPELLRFLGLAPTQSVDTLPAETIVKSHD